LWEIISASLPFLKAVSSRLLIEGKRAAHQMVLSKQLWIRLLLISLTRSVSAGWCSMAGEPIKEKETWQEYTHSVLPGKRT